MEVLEMTNRNTYEKELKDIIACWKNYCNDIVFSVANAEKMLKSSKKSLERAIEVGNESAIKRNEKLVSKAEAKYEEEKKNYEVTQIITKRINENKFAVEEDSCYSYTAETKIKTVILIFSDLDYYFKRYDNIDIFPQKGKLCKRVEDL